MQFSLAPRPQNASYIANKDKTHIYTYIRRKPLIRYISYIIHHTHIIVSLPGILGDGPDLEMISSLENLKAMLSAMLQKAGPAANPSFTADRPDLSVQDTEQAWAMENYARTKVYGGERSPVHRSAPSSKL